MKVNYKNVLLISYEFESLPCVESYTKVDMRTVSFDVPPQEVLTKDSVTVAVDAVGNKLSKNEFYFHI